MRRGQCHVHWEQSAQLSRWGNRRNTVSAPSVDARRWFVGSNKITSLGHSSGRTMPSQTHACAAASHVHEVIKDRFAYLPFAPPAVEVSRVCCTETSTSLVAPKLMSCYRMLALLSIGQAPRPQWTLRSKTSAIATISRLHTGLATTSFRTVTRDSCDAFTLQLAVQVQKQCMHCAQLVRY